MHLYGASFLLVRSGGLDRLCGDGGVRLWVSTGHPFTPEPVQAPLFLINKNRMSDARPIFIGAVGGT